ncbi:MAG: hypothetical protein A4E50_00518 [Methanosaeta sp. PtaB.Bin087]|nr:MAG: hypothetical protein A4E50_00518 [Methanosaeta sp. PtaB.Bin087]OPY56793.1 MAG: hypothetical protein A4E51_00304 [Methanosaeta sp. PtaU1.Bin055]
MAEEKKKEKKEEEVAKVEPIKPSEKRGGRKRLLDGCV